MNPGKLRQIIEIERPQYSTTASGARRVTGWLPVSKEAAERRQGVTQPRESLAAGIDMRANHIVEFAVYDRPSLAVDESMRIVCDGQVWEIINVSPMENWRDATMITCQRGLSVDASR